MKSKKNGSVLVFSLIVLAIVLSSALSITAVNVSNRKSATSTAQSVQSFQTADTATEKVMKAIYNGNYLKLDGEDVNNVPMLYKALNGDAINTCPNPVTVSVSGGTARVSFFDTNGAALTTADCSSVLWRDMLARVKVEGSGSTGGGAVRVIEVGIAPLSSMAWGENGDGRLGDGTTGTDRTSPVSTVGGSKWKSVSAGASHVLAVRTDGTLWAWGNGANYRLGNNLTGDVSSPIQIGTDNTWESVSAGGSHSLGIKTDHTLYAWGNAGQYRLGNNNNVNDVHTPTQIGTDTDWELVSAGDSHSLAIKMNGSLYAWGNAGQYRLGNNNNVNDVHTPTAIASCSPSCPSEWQSVSAGTSHSLAIGKDGTDYKLYAWGNNADGEVGNNSTSDVHTPTQIGASVNWGVVSAGNAFSIGVRK